MDVVTNGYVVGGSVHLINGRTLGNSEYPNLDVDVGQYAAQKFGSFEKPAWVMDSHEASRCLTKTRTTFY